MQFLARDSIMSLLFAAIACASNSNAAQASSSPAFDQLAACFTQHFDTPLCPKYKETLQCLEKSIPSSSRFYNIVYVKREMAGSCLYLTNKGTCLRVEFPKCTANFVDLRAANNPLVCNVAGHTLSCLTLLESRCSPKYPMSHEVRDTIQDCNTGYYTGKCSPREVDICVKPLRNDSGGRVGLAELERPPLCNQPLIESAERCLAKLQQFCTRKQLQYYQQQLDEVTNCVQQGK